jgi:hypothetical protein
VLNHYILTQRVTVIITELMVNHVGYTEWNDLVIGRECGLGDLVVLWVEFHVPSRTKGYETLHLHNIMRLGNVTKIVIGW